jgi:selenocysteine-specific elongation factor
VERHVVIGTAGHIDHGKTALVKALTGVDTDRWEEEKRRGITIDLGFAPLKLGDGLNASVVDVPGHEDFVRNMVAGATGVDVALLVVAADEGVMPQTVEHTAILDLLAVDAGVVALTKTDLVAADWLELVRNDVLERLANSSIHWEPPVAVSAVTGTGLDALRAALLRAARRARERAADDAFRLPIDRVFSLPGAGTVVTGTTWSGSVAVGDEVVVLPGPVRARVRSVEVHGRREERALPGRRTALALVGLERNAAGRGSVVVSDPSWRATAALDVMVTLLPEARRLTNRSFVRFHLGTSEVTARVVPAGDQLEPAGQAQAARLRLEEPLVARWGDRGVLRAASPPATIGGCLVVDPWPPSRPGRPRNAMERGRRDPIERVRAFVSAAGPRGLPLADLVVRAGLNPRDVDAVADRLLQAGVVKAGRRFVPRATEDEARRRLLDGLRTFHRDHPLLPGMSLSDARRLVGEAALASRLLDELSARGQVMQEGGTLRLAGHNPGLPPGMTRAAGVIRAALESAGYEGRTAAELAAQVPGESAQDIAEFFVREGTAIRVGKDRYYARAQLEEVAERLVAEVRKRGDVTTSELRTALGFTRKHLIPILEWMDAQGMTVRHGDVRRVAHAIHPSQ